jgi:hypothetical protein
VLGTKYPWVWSDKNDSPSLHPLITLGITLDMSTVIAVHTLPAGRYFLGDICYIMKDNVYNYWVDNLFGADGVFATASTGSFAVVSADGDGIYPVTLELFGHIQQTQFCTDANNFGLVPTPLIDEAKEKVADAQIGKADFVMGRKFIFKNPIKYIVKTDSRVITDGKFTITIRMGEPEVPP